MYLLWFFLINAYVFKYLQWTVVDQIQLVYNVACIRKSTTNAERRYSSVVRLDMSYNTTNTTSYSFQANIRFKILTKLIPFEVMWYTNNYNYSRYNWLSLIQ